MTFLSLSLLTDCANIIYTVKRGIFGITQDFPLFSFFLRVVWGLAVTQYQAIALFLMALMRKKIEWKHWYIPHILVNAGISSIFMYHAFFKYGVSGASPETLPRELALIHTIYLYTPFLFIPIFYKIFKKRNPNEHIPRILTHQLRSLSYFFIPYLICETLSNCAGIPASFTFSCLKSWEYLFFTLSSLLSTYPLFLVGKRILGLRFLNLRRDVESKEKFNFLARFKEILDQLNYATALKELAQLNQTFFHTAFAVPLGRTKLYFRKTDTQIPYYDSQIGATVESFLEQREARSLATLHSLKIFIRDEIAFNNFYENDPIHEEILAFMDAINADIFLPIYERTTIIGYSIIERNARPDKLFTNKERDEMLVFTSYLGNITTILKYSTLETMWQRHKELTDELYHKHQEINQYKEALRFFLRSGNDRKIGIVFFKQRHFSFANQAAKELVGMDLNTQAGHTVSRTFKTVAHHVQEYKTAYTLSAHDSKGNRIIIAGVPSLEDSTVILLVYYPEVSDIIKAQFDQLKDPSAWDYVLYLETTQSGQLINRLIAGSSEKILSFKIDLLSTALSKKATLLDMPPEDTAATVEILHHISLRQTLQCMTLTGPEKNNEIAVILFGLNPLLEKDSQSLLKKLHDVGTLFIENIEYLSLETQNALAHFISSGYFYLFKSDIKVFSNVRIICSTTKNLSTLVHEGTFSHSLYTELKKTSLAFPSLQSFSESELHELAQGFAEQIETSQTYKSLLALTQRDKLTLQNDRPLSLKELKEAVHHLLVEKSTKHNISEIVLDPAYDVAEPDIAHAVRLGKKALKDPQIMTLLWNKFKNQNKIALLLGCNRSSVNRRCQEYNLK